MNEKEPIYTDYRVNLCACGEEVTLKFVRYGLYEAECKCGQIYLKKEKSSDEVWDDAVRGGEIAELPRLHQRNFYAVIDKINEIIREVNKLKRAAHYHG